MCLSPAKVTFRRGVQKPDHESLGRSSLVGGGQGEVNPRWAEENFYNEGDPFGVPALWVFQVHYIGLDVNMATFEHVQRARWREGYDEPVFMKNGEVYELQ